MGLYGYGCDDDDDTGYSYVVSWDNVQNHAGKTQGGIFQEIVDSMRGVDNTTQVADK